tara:strand:- start:230 stop:502 length:273 start_codon:yes stop_codon:yes gene_type:complete
MKSPFNKTFMAKSPLKVSTEPEKKITPPNPEYFSESDARKHFGTGTREFMQWKLDKMGLSDPKENNKTGGGGIYDKFSDEDFKPSNPLYR